VRGSQVIKAIVPLAENVRLRDAHAFVNAGNERNIPCIFARYEEAPRSVGGGEIIAKTQGKTPAR